MLLLSQWNIKSFIQKTDILLRIFPVIYYKFRFFIRLRYDVDWTGVWVTHIKYITFSSVAVLGIWDLVRTFIINIGCHADVLVIVF